jgi:hypothetical protein
MSWLQWLEKMEGDLEQNRGLSPPHRQLVASLELIMFILGSSASGPASACGATSPAPHPAELH